jgi:hypothetical protein
MFENMAKNPTRVEARMSIDFNVFSVWRLQLRPRPVGQMIETEQPASANALASCQTRRSAQTGRFSTMMQMAGFTWLL